MPLHNVHGSFVMFIYFRLLLFMRIMFIYFRLLLFHIAVVMRIMTQKLFGQTFWAATAASFITIQCSKCYIFLVCFCFNLIRLCAIFLSEI